IIWAAVRVVGLNDSKTPVRKILYKLLLDAKRANGQFLPYAKQVQFEIFSGPVTKSKVVTNGGTLKTCEIMNITRVNFISAPHALQIGPSVLGYTGGCTYDSER